MKKLIRKEEEVEAFYYDGARACADLMMAWTSHISLGYAGRLNLSGRGSHEVIPPGAWVIKDRFGFFVYSDEEVQTKFDPAQVAAPPVVKKPAKSKKAKE
jgi:hypothetical protein